MYTKYLVRRMHAVSSSSSSQIDVRTLDVTTGSTGEEISTQSHRMIAAVQGSLYFMSTDLQIYSNLGRSGSDPEARRSSSRRHCSSLVSQRLFPLLVVPTLNTLPRTKAKARSHAPLTVRCRSLYHLQLVRRYLSKAQRFGFDLDGHDSSQRHLRQYHP